MAKARVRRQVIRAVLIVALVVTACTGGDDATPPDPGPDTPTTSGQPTSTSTPAVTTTQSAIQRLRGVWIGGDPVQWARERCLSSNGVTIVPGAPRTSVPPAATEACRDFAPQSTWQQELAGCLRAQGLGVAIGAEQQTPPGRGDSTLTTAAWAVCRATYVRTTELLSATVDASLWRADCLASKGWIAVLTPNDAGDVYRVDNELCAVGVVMRTCLRDNGATAGDPSVTLVRVQYAAVVAVAAWNACRSLWLRTSFEGWRGEAVLRRPDCMAARGWLVEDYTTAVGSPVPAYLADVEACEERNPLDAVSRCLRDRGIEAVDYSTAATPTPPMLTRYPPSDATAAWQTCRTLYIDALRAQQPDVNPILATTFADCMAARGWIVTTPSSGPDDPAGFAAANNECQEPRNGGALQRSGGLTRFPTLTEWAACFRAAGVNVATNSTDASNGTQVFDGQATTTAYVDCGGRFTGMPASTTHTCAANRGVVPGLAGRGTWEINHACDMTRLFLTGREISGSQVSFVRCLVESGVPTDALLRTFDAVVPAWERCTVNDAKADADVTIQVFDGTKANLATLRYWACLADNGLVVPDARVTRPDPDLAAARKAITTCAATAVITRAPRSDIGND